MQLRHRRLLLVGGISLFVGCAVIIGLTGAWLILSPRLPPIPSAAGLGESIGTPTPPAVDSSLSQTVRSPQDTATPFPTSLLEIAPPGVLQPLPTLISTVVQWAPTLPYIAPGPDSHPSSRPPRSTGICKDGAYAYAQESAGACAGHGGIWRWWGP